MKKKHTNQEEQRLQVLTDMLTQLHHGVDPNSLQEAFNQHFSGVSAIEIAMMEQKIIYEDDNDITFEDVLKLCNVHARMFEDQVTGHSAVEIEQENHPVQVFKAENMAFRACINRIVNIFKALEALNEEDPSRLDFTDGLKRQYQLLGQFEHHYTRKERVFFPLLEKYGYNAPPKVMWAKDDEIRDLFQAALKQVDLLKSKDFTQRLATAKLAFADFEYEFKEMIFKEEAILINILAESLSSQDWAKVSEQSNIYGFAIIRPTGTWTSSDEKDDDQHEDTTPLTKNVDQPRKAIIESQRISFPDGAMLISWESKPEFQATESYQQAIIDPDMPLPVGDGFLSINQMRIILDRIPVTLTFINSAGHIQYTNYTLPCQDKTGFPFQYRENCQIGMAAQTLFPASVWKTIHPVFEKLKSGQEKAVSYWFQETSAGGTAMIYVKYQSLFDDDHQFLGIVECVQDIQRFIDIAPGTDRSVKGPDEADLKNKKLTTLVRLEENLTSKQSETIQFSDGYVQVDWYSHHNQLLTRPDQVPINQPLDLENGYLSLAEFTSLMNTLPFEITYIDENFRFRYFNHVVPYDQMIFKRSPLEIGRDIEFCHPPRLWPKIAQLLDDLKNARLIIQPMRFSSPNFFAYIEYLATFDDQDQFRGVVEAVLDIQDYRNLANTEKHFF
ncbi:DUF438 domain-containing protein [Aerococcus viridans]